MSELGEDELRAALRSAVADEPPLTVDFDHLLHRAQREHRRRRAMLGVGLATALIVVVAAVLPGVLRKPQVSTAGPQLSTAAPATSTSPTLPPTADATPRTYSETELAATGAKFATVLHQAMAAAVPDAIDVSVGNWETGAQFQAPVIGDGALSVFVRFTIHGETTALLVEMWAPGATANGAAPRGCESTIMPTLHCTIATLADGTGLVVETGPGGDGVHGQSHLVIHYQPDGTAVMVSGYNYDPTMQGKDYLPSIPLTDQQLTAIATFPGFTFP